MFFVALKFQQEAVFVLKVQNQVTRVHWMYFISAAKIMTVNMDLNAVFLDVSDNVCQLLQKVRM